MEEARPILYGVSDYAEMRKANACFSDHAVKIRDREATRHAVFQCSRRVVIVAMAACALLPFCGTAAPMLIPAPQEMRVTGGECRAMAKPKIERVPGIPSSSPSARRNTAAVSSPRTSTAPH